MTNQITETPDLKVDLGRVTLKNPVLTASGTFGYAREFEMLIDLDRLGGIIVKGLSLNPTFGNPPPRIVETPCGMLNAIGLENVGLKAFIAEKSAFLAGLTSPVFVNIYGKTIEEYAQLAQRIDALDAIAGIEVNISCPNVKAGGVAFGADPDTAEAVTAAVRARTAKTVIVKLSPNVTDIGLIAQRVQAGGADAVSLINTITGMAIDIHTRRPKLANITGGLSGPAIKPVALRMVWQAAAVLDIPVIGIGGIMTAADAVEFLIAGATAVQVGTANFVNPGTVVDILEGIEAYLQEHRIRSLADIVGTIQID